MLDKFGRYGGHKILSDNVLCEMKCTHRPWLLLSVASRQCLKDFGGQHRKLRGLSLEFCCLGC